MTKLGSGSTHLCLSPPRHAPPVTVGCEARGSSPSNKGLPFHPVVTGEGKAGLQPHFAVPASARSWPVASWAATGETSAGKSRRWSIASSKSV